ncbi:MAG TPA: TadE/TadG family type IV pilus assembly protein [Pyrinomonadaceae bacterium]
MHFKTDKNQRGAGLVEFALVGGVFLTVLFGVVEFGRLLWTHNALMDATRRGTRYATLRKDDTAGQLAVKKMVVYGDPNANPATAQPVVSGLTTSDVAVSYANYNGIQLSAKATVSITNYQFRFAIPMIGGTLTMPSYQTSLPGESAGIVPCDIPTATPLAPCNIIPN